MIINEEDGIMESHRATTSLDSSRRDVLSGGAAILAAVALTAAIGMTGTSTEASRSR